MTATHAFQLTGRIAALQGAPTETIQAILSRFAEELKRGGFRVAGVVEVSRCSPTGACKSLAVRDLTSEAVIKFSQDSAPVRPLATSTQAGWPRRVKPWSAP